MMRGPNTRGVGTHPLPFTSVQETLFSPLSFNRNTSRTCLKQKLPGYIKSWRKASPRDKEYLHRQYCEEPHHDGEAPS